MRPGKKYTMGVLPSLLVLIAMLITACGGGGNGSNATSKPTPAPKSQQIFRRGLPVSDLKTLDPSIVTDLYSAQAMAMIYTGLVELDDKLQVKPQLAQSWDVSPDGLTYTFHLRPNLQFSDGKTLNANDVAYSIDRALSPAQANQTGVVLTYLGLIKDAANRVNGKVSTLIGDSLKVVDDNTIQIIVSKKTAYFMEALTYTSSYIVEKSVITQWGAKWTDHLSDNGGQGGDGPFVVQNYNHSTGLTLVPNPKYYGKAQTLQKVFLAFYQDLDTMYKAYQAGQLDSSAVPAADTAQAQANKAEYRQQSSLSIFYIALNYLYKPFDNIDIRQAFSLAINRDIIAKNINKGLVTASCHIVPEGMPGYNPNLKCPGGGPTKGDPAKAKQLFQQGLTAEGLTTATFPQISITYPTGAKSTADEVAAMTQAWQTVLGVTIKSQAVDFSTLLTQTNNTTCQTPDTPSKCLNKGLPMWWLGWIGDYPDPQDWTTLQFAKGAASNNWNYGQNLSSAAANQVKVQQTLEQADADLGSDRMSLYNQAEEQLVNDVAWMSLYQSDIVGVVKKYVQGLVTNAQDVRPPDDWADIYISAH